jgi:hypothetical protein
VIPLYGFLEGDTLGLLVLASAEDTAAELAAKLQQSARVRRAARPSMKVVYRGRIVDPAETVGHANMEALDRFDVVEG